MMKIGLLQINGDTEDDSEYRLRSPIFDVIKFHQNPEYY